LNLNYKRIPYKTVWVEYPYIKPLYLELKQEPTTIANGKPEYTLPAIHDPNTGTFVSDSFRIAQYLDKTYPDRPLIPEGTAGLQSAFDAYMWSIIRQVCGHASTRGVAIRQRSY
jgi:glutathione S-transferase